MGLDPLLEQKWERLLELVRSYGSAAVAFSGGVDSALVCAAAYQTLGERMLAVTIHSPVEARRDVVAAESAASALGFPHRLIELDDLADPSFVANSPERCYHCKHRRMRALLALAGELGLAHILDGTHHDDSGDYRPGQRALAELGVRSPLAEAGLEKREIRLLAKQAGIPAWDRPASPCLATRIPYGTPVTLEALDRIAQAEEYLASLGCEPVRVRDYGPLARIEVAPELIVRLAEQGAQVSAHLKTLGYHHIALDLAGYRTGSMNEVLGL
jgi:pyridinium-3,5-biscarboxylic acid mononucleotide sulfurtransferase